LLRGFSSDALLPCVARELDERSSPLRSFRGEHPFNMKADGVSLEIGDFRKRYTGRAFALAS
jgi:hypothetical protein